MFVYFQCLVIFTQECLAMTVSWPRVSFLLASYYGSLDVSNMFCFVFMNLKILTGAAIYRSKNNFRSWCKLITCCRQEILALFAACTSKKGFFPIYRIYTSFCYTLALKLAGGGGGGVKWNQPVCLSVHSSVDARFGKMFQSHNWVPFTPIIMKLVTQTPQESRMCSIDVQIKRLKIKVTVHE